MTTPADPRSPRARDRRMADLEEAELHAARAHAERARRRASRAASVPLAPPGLGGERWDSLDGVYDDDDAPPPGARRPAAPFMGKVTAKCYEVHPTTTSAPATRSPSPARAPPRTPPASPPRPAAPPRPERPRPPGEAHALRPAVACVERRGVVPDETKHAGVETHERVERGRRSNGLEGSVADVEGVAKGAARGVASSDPPLEPEPKPSMPSPPLSAVREGALEPPRGNEVPETIPAANEKKKRAPDVTFSPKLWPGKERAKAATNNAAASPPREKKRSDGPPPASARSRSRARDRSPDRSRSRSSDRSGSRSPSPEVSPGARVKPPKVLTKRERFLADETALRKASRSLAGAFHAFGSGAVRLRAGAGAAAARCGSFAAGAAGGAAAKTRAAGGGAAEAAARLRRRAAASTLGVGTIVFECAAGATRFAGANLATPCVAYATRAVTFAAFVATHPDVSWNVGAPALVSLRAGAATSSGGRARGWFKIREGEWGGGEARGPGAAPAVREVAVATSARNETDRSRGGDRSLGVALAACGAEVFAFQVPGSGAGSGARSAALDPDPFARVERELLAAKLEEPVDVDALMVPSPRKRLFPADPAEAKRGSRRGEGTAGGDHPPSAAKRLDGSAPLAPDDGRFEDLDGFTHSPPRDDEGHEDEDDVREDEMDASDADAEKENAREKTPLSKTLGSSKSRAAPLSPLPPQTSDAAHLSPLFVVPGRSPRRVPLASVDVGRLDAYEDDPDLALGARVRAMQRHFPAVAREIAGAVYGESRVVGAAIADAAERNAAARVVQELEAASVAALMRGAREPSASELRLWLRRLRRGREGGRADAWWDEHGAFFGDRDEHSETARRREEEKEANDQRERGIAAKNEGSERAAGGVVPTAAAPLGPRFVHRLAGAFEDWTGRGADEAVGAAPDADAAANASGRGERSDSAADVRDAFGSWRRVASRGPIVKATAETVGRMREDEREGSEWVPGDGSPEDAKKPRAPRGDADSEEASYASDDARPAGSTKKPSPPRRFFNLIASPFARRRRAGSPHSDWGSSSSETSDALGVSGYAGGETASVGDDTPDSGSGSSSRHSDAWVSAGNASAMSFNTPGSVTSGAAAASSRGGGGGGGGGPGSAFASAAGGRTPTVYFPESTAKKTTGSAFGVERDVEEEAAALEAELARLGTEFATPEAVASPGPMVFERSKLAAIHPQPTVYTLSPTSPLVVPDARRDGGGPSRSASSASPSESGGSASESDASGASGGFFARGEKRTFARPGNNAAAASIRAGVVSAARAAFEKEAASRAIASPSETRGSRARR